MRLYPHQKHGVTWMIAQEERYGCGILADEMGLGKTIQLAALIKMKPVAKTLLLVPKAISSQWLEELDGKGIAYKKRGIGSDGFVTLVTHGVMAYLSDNHEILTTNWDRIIIDEAHILCNPQSWQSRAVRKLRGRYKWVATGTPCCRRPTDMFQYVRFLKMPDYEELTLFEIRNNFMLRRRCEDINNIALPPLTIENVRLPFRTEVERTHYHRLLNKLNMLTGNGDIHFLERAIRLEQLSIHPEIAQDAIFDKTQDPDDICFSVVSETKLNYIVDDYLQHREPTLVFCRFTNEIDRLHAHMKAHKIATQILDGRNSYEAPTYPYISKVVRQLTNSKNMSDDYFNKIWTYLRPCQLLLAQVKSASVGLNLQYYRRVYFNLPMWNPYHQKQAIARAHRLGQLFPVHVKTLCLCDQNEEFKTIDEHIIEVQNAKVEAIENFIAGGILSS